MSAWIPVQTHPFKRDFRTPSRLTRQWNDPLVGSDALCLQVNLPILVPVKAVMPIGMRGREAVQSARRENDADRFGRPVLVKFGVARHRPVAHARIGAEQTGG